MQCSKNIACFFSHYLLKKFNVVTTCDFSICYKIILRFLQSSNICKLCDNFMLQFFVLFVALTRMVAILSVVKNKLI